MTPQGPATHRVGNKNIWRFNVSLLPCMEQEGSRYWLVDFLIRVLLKADGLWWEWTWRGSERSDNWLVKRTLNRRGGKPAWGGEPLMSLKGGNVCVTLQPAINQSRCSIWSLIQCSYTGWCGPWIMKQINLWLWGWDSSAAHWGVEGGSFEWKKILIWSSFFYEPAECIPQKYANGNGIKIYWGALRVPQRLKENAALLHKVFYFLFNDYALIL